MQNFKHKVQSQSGASMLMALFLLLVVTVVSVVILVSATSAAHQVRGQPRRTAGLSDGFLCGRSACAGICEAKLYLYAYDLYMQG